jgi:hypothetical protein
VSWWLPQEQPPLKSWGAGTSGSLFWLGFTSGSHSKQFLFTNEPKSFFMVQVMGYNEGAKKDGTTFITLELSVDLELVQSAAAVAFYVTIRNVGSLRLSTQASLNRWSASRLKEML